MTVNASISAPVPSASKLVFQGGIKHPDLWLWDSWMVQHPAGKWNLYCLALSRTSQGGAPILPSQRNDSVFHIRHFTSSDAGITWRDAGPVLSPGNMPDGADARNVWSGSVLPLNDQQIAFGYTGIRVSDAERQFIQTICVATGPNFNEVTNFSRTALSCPIRDYDIIRKMGYYLGPRNTLGSNSGEEGGPILAWRDPFLFRADDGQLHAFWSAKSGPAIPVIAHATLRVSDGEIKLDELMAPIELPDASLFTQAEVPKIYYDETCGRFLLLISACNRIFEGQPDSEVNQEQRLYQSTHIRGPWLPICENESLLSGLDYMFGSSVMQINLSTGELKLMGPYTENAGTERQLSFSQPVTLELDISPSGENTEVA